MRYLLLFVVFLFVSLSTVAQRNYFGCHYFNNGKHKAKKLSAADQKALDASILRSDTIDIFHYDLTLDVTDYSGSYLIGEAVISYSPKVAGVESMILDLYNLNVDSVFDEMGAVDYNYDGEFLQVYFDTPPTVGTEYEINVHYQGDPHQDPNWGGFYFESEYIYNLGIGLTTIPPNFGKVWYPCFDSFLERATYTYHVKTANGYVAHCQGTMLDETLLEGDTIVRTFNMNQPIPTYLSAIAAAAYEDYDYVHTGANGDIPVRLTGKTTQMAGMQTAFQELEYCIDALEDYWGEYGWERVGYVLTTDGALEIPTNIAYPSFMTGETLTNNGLLFTHELGHHWWGDWVSPRTYNDMWIKEGPAEFSGHLFIERRDGFDAYIEEVKDNHLFVLEQAHVDDNGFHPLSGIPDEEIYGRHTYYKGASVIHNLRGYLGDDLFKSGMQEVLTEMTYSNMHAAQFRDSLSNFTDYDLTSFWDDWIFNPGYSTFVVDSVVTTGWEENYQVTVYVQQKLREAPAFHTNVPLDLTFFDQNWNTYDFQVMADGQYSEFTFDVPYAPWYTTLNRYNKINQARMDYEQVIDQTTGVQNKPFVDFRFGTNAIADGDSAFIRVEHQWAAPDNNYMAPYISEISNTHYWIVDGIWPASVECDGRVGYNGAEQTDLDYDLFGFSEADAMLVWRPNSAEPWIIHPGYELNAGNLNNGTGTIQIDPLLRGQYAFAKGDVANAISSIDNEILVSVYPNPASEVLFIQANLKATNDVQKVQLIDGKGAIAFESPIQITDNKLETSINVSELAQGYYQMVLIGNSGIAGSKKVQIQ